MITLRRKVLVWVSAIVVTLALLGLPGCGKKPESSKAGKTGTAPAKKKAMKDME
jgi:hypothetical protein